MADPVGAADLNRLPDRLDSKGLACVNGYIEVFLTNKFKGIQVFLWRVTELVTRYIRLEVDPNIGVGLDQGYFKLGHATIARGPQIRRAVIVSHGGTDIVFHPGRESDRIRNVELTDPHFCAVNQCGFKGLR